MTDVQDITEEEACSNLAFLLKMTERNRTVCEDGSVALLSPVIQSGPPIDKDVLDAVEEFRQEVIADESDA